MSIPPDRPTRSYPVTCHSCHQEFEALDTAWCACLVTEPTLLCNSCGGCFCKAPPQYKRRFWEEAPEPLWDRKMEMLRRRRPAQPNPAPEEVARPLVLLVDPNHAVQRATARVAAGLGYGLILAENGSDGLERAKSHRPEIVLAEAFLSKLDGREMCRRLRLDPEFAKTRMVILTGLYTSTAHRTEGLRDFKVDDYLTKPLRSEDLETLLRRLAP